MVAVRDMSTQSEVLEALAESLEQLDLGYASGVPGDGVATERDRLVRTIRTYLLPRLLDPTAPLRVVFAGPTGSGKSTLINSITGMELSPAGALRPTTSVPIALASSAHTEQSRTIGGVDCKVVTGEAAVLEHMTLVDTPDIDSTSVEHRAVAETLIDHSDVVVFVTSALRYADAVPWQVLRRAEARGGAVIHVLNRVGSSNSGAVVDFSARLRNAGLSDDLVTVPEHHLASGSQRIPATSVRSLARRLASIARARRSEDDSTFERVLASTVSDAEGIARDVDFEYERYQRDLEDLSAALATRAEGLFLAGVADGVLAPFPEPSTPRAVRKWRREARLGPEQVKENEAVVVDRIVAAAHGDLRRWLADEQSMSSLAPEKVLGPALAAVRESADGWMRYVKRIVEEGHASEQWLAEAVLVQAATDEEESRAASEVFGEYALMVAERARRELAGRLQVAYELAAVSILEATAASPDLETVSALESAISSLRPSVSIDA